MGARVLNSLKKCCTKEGKEGKGVVEGGTNQKVRHLKKGGTKGGGGKEI
jgi:hypothetical protein